MKHLITFICLVMLSIAGTQNAQAQTKEETVDWLNTYANRLMSQISKAHTFEGLDENGNIKKSRGTTNLVKDYWVEDIYDVYKIDVNGNKNDKIWQVRLTEKHEASDGGNNVSVFYFDNEEDAKRVHKAFLHFAKLLGTKPKPKANTF